MVKYDLVGLTNALMDVTVNVGENVIERLGVKKGVHVGLKDLDDDERQYFDENISAAGVESVGGSPANVVYTASTLGLETAVCGTVADDGFGLRYDEAMRRHDVVPRLNVADGMTGVCYALITPDGERTFIADMGVSKEIGSEYPIISMSRHLHTSAYELKSRPENVLGIMESARSFGATVSFDLADPQMLVGEMRPYVFSAIEKSNILFASVEEAGALLDRNSYGAFMNGLPGMAPIVAFKHGSSGSQILCDSDVHSIPVYSAKPNFVNANGAGDAYAAGFLAGHLRGMGLLESGHYGSFVASRVCSKSTANLSRE